MITVTTYSMRDKKKPYLEMKNTLIVSPIELINGFIRNYYQYGLWLAAATLCALNAETR